MTSHNSANERIKRQYFAYLREASRYSEASLDKAAAAIHRFEAYTKYRDFKSFRIEQAIAFKRHLLQEKSPQTGKALSKATANGTLSALRKFFHWLAGRPGFRSRLSYDDADYFNLPEKDVRVAKAHKSREGPAIEQIRHVLNTLPATTDIEKRDRALIAFALLTGARDSAIASFRLKHLDIASGRVDQDAREVRTKFSKTFRTWFFPVGDDIRQIVEEWVRFLREDKLWGPEDPLFPATALALDESNQFAAVGLERRHWSNADPVRKLFRRAFEGAGLSYFNPHSFRNTLAKLGEQVCQTPEQFKAWSQNLGHEKVMTTFMNYGQVSGERQEVLIRGLGHPKEQRVTNAEMEVIAGLLTRIGRSSF